MVAVNDNINIYKLESASVIGTITNPKRISSLKFLNVSSQINSALCLKGFIPCNYIRITNVGDVSLNGCLSFRTPSWPLQETMKLCGYAMYKKPNGCVSSRLMKPGILSRIVSPACLFYCKYFLS